MQPKLDCLSHHYTDGAAIGSRCKRWRWGMRAIRFIFMTSLMAWTGCAHSLPYHISLDAPASLSEASAPVAAPSSTCTLHLGEVIKEALNDVGRNGDPYLAFDIHESGTKPNNEWDVRKVQLRVERRIQEELNRLEKRPADVQGACP